MIARRSRRSRGSPSSPGRVAAAASLLLAAAAVCGCGSPRTGERAEQPPRAAARGDPLDAPRGRLAADWRELLATGKQEADGYYGSARCLDRDGTAALHVFVKDGPSFERLRARLRFLVPEEVAVFPLYISKFEAVGKDDCADAAFDMPVPIGVSVGRAGGDPGTAGSRVRGGGRVFLLSNSHVLAPEEITPRCGDIEQPAGGGGRRRIASLHCFVPINKWPGGENLVDAALAGTREGQLSSATPSGGYGSPRSDVMSARLGLAVMKHGRCGMTSGRIRCLDGTLIVDFGSYKATFERQIVIEGVEETFARPGDSGSLVVASEEPDRRRPVGLLFAVTGRYALANPIEAVLDRLGVNIDGGDGRESAGGVAAPPKAVADCRCGPAGPR